MPLPARRALLALATAAAAALIGACGGDDEGQGGTSGAPVTTDEANVTEQLFAGTAMDNRQSPAEGKKGGKLTVLSAGDVDFLDPGKTYYVYSIGIFNMLHRGLYAYPPQENEPVPDLAAGMPEISGDGKTVTVKLKEGVTYTPPVSREVTSADVKYAVERAFTANVANGYAGVYFSDIKGAPGAQGDYKAIPGIETPDDQTIVFHLTKGTGPALAGALAMPISVPVPKEYAEKYDKEIPVDLRRGPRGLHRPVHGRVRRRGQDHRIRARPPHPHRPQSRLRGRRRLPARRISTSSSSSPATTTAPWPPGGSSRARTWRPARSIRPPAS